VLAFEAEDVVRHAMVERIVRAYDADASRGRPVPDLEDPSER
jgi:phosphate starvation-inducible PhoH-like protein